MLDYWVVVFWLVLTLVAGTVFSRRASGSTEDFFVSGRSLPWWLVGTSMVATTFAADTPLVVSGWVASKGIAENWVWWTIGLSGPLAVFYFSRLWRRAGILTDAELVELRYGGALGHWLRVVKALWFGVFMNTLVIAWVMGAMTKIVTLLLGLEGVTLLGMPGEVTVVLGLFLLTAVYTSASGLWGVVATDVVQFVVAISASVALAVLAWGAVGGSEGLRAAFSAQGLDWERTTTLVPSLGGALDGSGAQWVLIVAVVWWSQSNVDGGGYLAQRLFAARDERHALWAYLWFTVAHLCLRPWPWIIVGLAGMATLGPVDDPETLYPRMMMALLSPGWLGLMFASFLAAFMSTIDTQLNWGASMLVHDVYQRAGAKGALERLVGRGLGGEDAHHLAVSRLAVLVLAAVGAGVSFLVHDIGLAWKLAISVTAGLGAVYLARWYWWRVSGWSEVSAMAVAAVMTLVFSVLSAHHPAAHPLGWTWLAVLPAGWLGFPFSTAATVAISLPVWVGVTLATRPADPEVLLSFYRRVRPGGPGWRAVAGHLPGFAQDGPGWQTLVGMVASWVAVYGALFAVGGLLLGRPVLGLVAAVLALGGAVLAGFQVARETAGA